MSESVLAIDPGITTGVVQVSMLGEIIAMSLIGDPPELIATMKELLPTHIVIEDFVGAGPRTKEAIHVLKLIGIVTGASYVLGLNVLLQVPQERIPFLYEAKQRFTESKKFGKKAV